MARSNNGSSMPNQGSNRSTKGSGGGKLAASRKRPAKQDAKVWKSKGMKNPSIPDWIG